MPSFEQTAAQFDNQLARLQALPAAVDETIALLEDGLKRGITPPQIILRDVPQQVLNQIPDEPLKSPLLGGFASNRLLQGRPKSRRAVKLGAARPGDQPHRRARVREVAAAAGALRAPGGCRNFWSA